MAYPRIDQLIEKLQQFFDRDRERLEQEKAELESLDRSPSAVSAKGVGSALGGSILRKNALQPFASLGQDFFNGQGVEFFKGNLTDFFDGDLGSLNPLNGQIFSKLQGLTGLDPNRAFFDVVQRATEDFVRRGEVLSSEVSELVDLSSSLRDEINSILPSGGAWFTDQSDGVRGLIRRSLGNNLLAREEIANLLARAQDGWALSPADLEVVKDLVLKVREDIVPLNADARPTDGVDHPQTAALLSLSRMADLQSKLTKKLARVQKECKLYVQQKNGVADFRSDENVQLGGRTGTREILKMVRRFDEYLGDIESQQRAALGNAGISAVFTNQLGWVTKMETIIGVLDKPLMKVGPQAEDGGAYDALTNQITDAFSSLSSGLSGVADFDDSTLVSAVQTLSSMAGGAAGNANFSTDDVTAVLESIVSEGASLQGFVSTLSGVVDGSELLSGIIPKLDEVTGFIDTLRKGNMDTAADFLLSGVLYKDGIGRLDVRSVDSKGALAEELRRASGSVAKVINQQRLREGHRQLEADERRRRRVAQTYEDAIEQAKTENEFKQVQNDELQRELEQVVKELEEQ